MSDLQFKQRMTKKAFETRIVTDLGSEGISSCPYTEHGATISKMTLYYKNNSHVGTWMTGKGWAFKSAYTS